MSGFDNRYRLRSCSHNYNHIIKRITMPNRQQLPNKPDRSTANKLHSAEVVTVSEPLSPTWCYFLSLIPNTLDFWLKTSQCIIISFSLGKRCSLGLFPLASSSLASNSITPLSYLPLHCSLWANLIIKESWQLKHRYEGDLFFMLAALIRSSFMPLMQLKFN